MEIQSAGEIDETNAAQLAAPPQPFRGGNPMQMDWREMRRALGDTAYALVGTTILVTLFATFMAAHGG